MEVYIDKTIMKVEANEACTNSGIRLQSLLNSIAHDRRHIGACARIEGCIQLSF